ncbi:MAG: YibE/F family protein [Treponemataceae bacterium]
MESKPNNIEIVVTTNAIGYVLTIIFSVLFLVIGSFICDPNNLLIQDDKFYSAKILRIENIDTSSSDEVMETKTITFYAKIKDGEFKNEIIEGLQEINSFVPFKQREVQAGDSVILVQFNNFEGAGEWRYSGHSRQTILFWMICIFLLCVIFLGKAKGVATNLSLIFSTLTIFQIYIPGILKGYNIYLLTIIVSFFIIFSSLIIINGLNSKTFAAIFGNLVGVILAGLCAVFMSFILDFTGIIDASFIVLQELNPENPIDLRAILWGGVVIGSLGAVMDVAMTISSALQEIYDTMQKKSFMGLVKSGMNIGKDAIGTMTNTLILAYIGSSLATVLLFSAHNKNLLYLINTEKIASEIVQAVIGSMGILFAVPATVLGASYILTKKKEQSF